MKCIFIIVIRSSNQSSTHKNDIIAHTKVHLLIFIFYKNNYTNEYLKT